MKDFGIFAAGRIFVVVLPKGGQHAAGELRLTRKRDGESPEHVACDFLTYDIEKEAHLLDAIHKSAVHDHRYIRIVLVLPLDLQRIDYVLFGISAIVQENILFHPNS